MDKNTKTSWDWAVPSSVKAGCRLIELKFAWFYYWSKGLEILIKISYWKLVCLAMIFWPKSSLDWKTNLVKIFFLVKIILWVTNFFGSRHCLVQKKILFKNFFGVGKFSLEKKWKKIVGSLTKMLGRWVKAKNSVYS